MKKFLFALFVVLFSTCLVFNATAKDDNTTEARRNFNIKKHKIKVYIDNFKNSSQESQIDLAEMKSIFKDTLIKRRDIVFLVATIPNDADMIIEPDIKKFEYKEVAPLNYFAGGTPGIVVQVLTKPSYAVIEVDFDIKDINNNKNLIKNVKAELRKTNMPRHESYAYSMQEISKDFISEYFYPKSRNK